jgi:glutamine amidotransferase
VVAVVDYGMGNLRSMGKAIEHVGGEVVVTSRVEDLEQAERIVLPGVGAFGEAMANLHATGLVEAMEREVLRGRKPFLGVCVGMQLLAGGSVEHGRHEGLGWIDASVLPLPVSSPDLRVPHTGWNEIEVVGGHDGPLGRVRAAESFYFTHSFQVVPADESLVAARCNHGESFVAAVARENILAVQFHPEKSQQAGLEFLADFLAWEPALVAG